MYKNWATQTSTKIKNKSPEYELQKSIVEYLKVKRLLFCASIAGVRLPIPTAVKMKNAGYIKGAPDIFIYENNKQYHGLALEIKSKVGIQSEEQKAWERALEERDYKYCLINNFSEAIAIIDDYIDKRVEKGKILPTY